MKYSLEANRNGHKIWLGDSIKLMKEVLPKESVSLIFTSPPYNIGIDYGKDLYGRKINDNKPMDKYLKFLMDFVEGSKRVLKKGGFLAVNLPVSINKREKNTTTKFPLSALFIGKVYKKHNDLIYKSTIPWVKPIAGVFKKGVRIGSPVNNPYFSEFEEYIIVFRKTNQKRELPTEPNVSREYIELVSSPWEINPSMSDRKQHPTAFPFKLALNAVKTFTVAGETVLDPFMGTGVTLRAAIENKRIAWGIDISPDFIEIAKQYTGLGSTSIDHFF